MVLVAFPRPKNILNKPVWNKPNAAHVHCFFCDSEQKTWYELDQHIADEDPAVLDEIERIRRT